MTKFFTALLISTLTFAGTTATLNLKGTVGAVVDIAVVAEGDSESLDLSTGVTDKKVGTVTEKSNSNVGYKVAVSSTNNGNLKHANNDVFAYSLTYGGEAADLANGGKTFNRATTGVSVQTKDVNVTYSGKSAASMVSGAYSDVVTFTITAN